LKSQIRELLKVKRNDSLEWKVEDSKVFVEAVSKLFLNYRGSVKVGAGNIARDIEKAREGIAGK